MSDLQDVFGEVISAYTRAQAIEDGILVDVSETAREAGIRYPVALTRAVWESCVTVPVNGKGQPIPWKLTGGYVQRIEWHYTEGHTETEIRAYERRQNARLAQDDFYSTKEAA